MEILSVDESAVMDELYAVIPDFKKMAGPDNAIRSCCHDVARVRHHFHHLKPLFTQVPVAAHIVVAKPEDVTELVG